MICNVPEKLIKKYQHERLRIEEYIGKRVHKGKDLRWGKGRYKGRICQIKDYFWEYGHWKKPKQIRIWVSVKTYTVKENNKVFIDDTDSIHRRYYDLYDFVLE